MAEATQVSVPEAPAKAKKPREVLQQVFKTAEEVTGAVEARTKGPRRAFKATHGNKTLYVAANNEGRAGGVAFMELGGQVEEIGRKARAPKAIGVDGIMAGINALPETDRAAVLAQLKTLVGGAAGNRK